MEPMIIDKTSWHYCLVKKYVPSAFRQIEYDGFQLTATDICQYTKEVFKAISKLLLFGFLGCLVGSFFVNMIVWFVVGLIQGTFVEMDKWGFAAVAIIVAIMFAFTIAGMSIGIVRLINLYSWKRSDKKISFIVQAYRSWKDKYCMKIEVK